MAQRKDREAYWQEKINEFKQSALTQREFCRQQGISYWSFNTWNRRLSASPAEETGIVEVTSRAFAAQTAVTESFEIILSESLRIRIPETFKPETLSRIIDALDTER